MPPTRNSYDEYASAYSALMTVQEQAGIPPGSPLARFLQVVGEVSGLKVLDAGCGEGYLSRILARQGAQVTGIDIAARAVEIARTKALADQIIYQVADLSQPQPAYQDSFDLITSYFVLNDVAYYRGFLATLGAMLKRAGHLVLLMNNPYGLVVKSYATDYFASGQAFASRGLAEAGVKVHLYHRTLEEYLDACFAAGLQLERLVDVPTPEGSFKRRDDTLIPPSYHFPFFMIMRLVKA
jgi:2-polyprenyl-3-methyl-5-hydroxy-6-metoxy-1,4-benzoquinol methylase